MSPEEPSSQPLLAMLDVPGGYVAVAAGCRCSVLVNSDFRAGAHGAEPLIDPSCPLHTRVESVDAGTVELPEAG